MSKRRACDLVVKKHECSSNFCEVLSPASETFDRIYKWREYRSTASLRHYVLIEEKERRVEVWSRTKAGWALATVEPPSTRSETRDALAEGGLSRQRPLRSGRGRLIRFMPRAASCGGRLDRLRSSR